MPIIAIVLGLAIIAFGSYLLINKDDSEDNVVVTRQEESTTTKIVPNDTTSTTETEIINISESITTDTEPVPEKKPVAAKPAEKPVSQTKTYTDEATYRKSDNLYTIDVTLQVKDGTVVDADVMYGNKETGYQHPLQERFDGVYKTSVIGKKLEDINLSRVGGASLTSKAFNEAVADIIKQTNT